MKIVPAMFRGEIMKYTSDVKRGQILEAEAEAKDKSPRPKPRPRTNLRGRGRGRGQNLEAEAKAQDNFPTPHAGEVPTKITGHISHDVSPTLTLIPVIYPNC